MALGLRHFAERVGEGSGQPRLAAEELVHMQPAVSIALDHGPVESPGTLYITTKKVVWLSDVDRAKGYSVDFLSVSLHAVSRDPEAYPFPCIYTQIETAADEDEATDSDVECNEEFDLTKVTEMRLVPSDPSRLDTLFSVFCECAELNPDPNAEPDEENEWIFGDGQMINEVYSWVHSFSGLQGDLRCHFSDELANPIGCANGDHDIADTVLELQINDERFDDAEESESHMQGGHR